ncbi:hypothetical protein JCM19274_2967 [Algibacter lectus]|uniref:Uncharacterized protein n=1 Tax=Algibacter lectus TaxID=221126 RepID=A0A090WZD3_9FLAO|nr:hypothetical protein [Algibacter lectus]GAL82450.1 hypothetical protein JCM19274_2967 [Algibacter lectus]
MSIFPKRTIPGKTVTIHWNFNTSHLDGAHLYPLVKIGIKDPPKNNITMLFEEHVIAFPDQKKSKKESLQKLKYLNKNIPLLVLADYLEGPCKREKLVEILTNIQAGRHYYFTYTIPHDAPLGKYSLISEVHNNGNVKYSKTRLDDHFWVEKISLVTVTGKGKDRTAVIRNHSEERTPVKIVRCSIDLNGHMESEMEAFEMNPKDTKPISISEEKVFLLYNEERETVTLTEEEPIYLVKNHEILSISKKNGLDCLMEKDNDEAYWLSPEAKDLWDKSDGLLSKNSLSEKEKEVLKEMEEQGLIKQTRL